MNFKFHAFFCIFFVTINDIQNIKRILVCCDRFAKRSKSRCLHSERQEREETTQSELRFKSEQTQTQRFMVLHGVLSHLWLCHFTSNVFSELFSEHCSHTDGHSH